MIAENSFKVDKWNHFSPLLPPSLPSPIAFSPPHSLCLTLSPLSSLPTPLLHLHSFPPSFPPLYPLPSLPPSLPPPSSPPLTFFNCEYLTKASDYIFSLQSYGLK